jgi:hypothetical protein
MSIPQSVASFAYRVSGPIDAAINLVLNTAIPWYFLRGTDSVPLVGIPSFYVFVGPMVFCALFFPSWMGYVNGLRVTTGKPSYRKGIARALRIAAIGSAVFGVLVLLLHRAQPELRIPTLATILIDGVGSAILGYWMQVAGVFTAYYNAVKRAPSPSA